MKSTSRVYSSNTTFSRMDPKRMAFQISGSDSCASKPLKSSVVVCMNWCFPDARSHDSLLLLWCILAFQMSSFGSCARAEKGASAAVAEEICCVYSVVPCNHVALGVEMHQDFARSVMQRANKMRIVKRSQQQVVAAELRRVRGNGIASLLAGGAC